MTGEQWAKLGLIGGGALLLIAGLNRLRGVGFGGIRRTAVGRPLILYMQGQPEDREFRSTAQRIENVKPNAIVTPVRSREQVWAAIDMAPSGLHPVVLVGHGTTRTFFPQFGGVTPDALASRLAGKLAPHAVIGLAGCRSGDDPGTADWQPESFGPGGARSFAALLRDALVQHGAPRTAEVRAHSTVGHVTANPAARAFPLSEPGQPGRSVIDMVMGAGSWQRHAARRAWTQQTRGKVSEMWVSGGPLPPSSMFA